MWRNWNTCALLIGMENGAATVGNSLTAPQKADIKLPNDPAIPLLGILSKRTESRDSGRYLYTPVHSSIIHNSQKVEITKFSLIGQQISKM